jgi:tRNA (guanosine-2'-O-)-methyltransferase
MVNLVFFQAASRRKRSSGRAQPANDWKWNERQGGEPTKVHAAALSCPRIIPQGFLSEVRQTGNPNRQCGENRRSKSCFKRKAESAGPSAYAAHMDEFVRNCKACHAAVRDGGMVMLELLNEKMANMNRSRGGETMDEQTGQKSSVRKRANEIKQFRCKNLIAVLENPADIKNIGTVVRNVNGLGVEKVYIVDPNHSLPDDWQELRNRKSISKTSVSAVKWTFVRRFDSTDECFDYLEKKNFKSIVTSPHVKGKSSIFLHEGDYTTHSKLAVWFGSESLGISNRAVERSEMCVAIPMFGMIESLNLGTSSGIVLYEVAKQRREYQSKFRWRDQRGPRATPLPTVIAPREVSTGHLPQGTGVNSSEA